jgi:hypothetical protein
MRKLHFWEWSVGFEPRDIWVGVYWKKWPNDEFPREVLAVEVFICLLPCLPLRLYLQWHHRDPAGQ